MYGLFRCDILMSLLSAQGGRARGRARPDIQS